MPNDRRTPEEIERDIEHERAELRGTLEDIQDRFSLEGVSRQVGEQLREHGGDLSKSIARSVRDNPMALALTGIGLAWMIFGEPRGRHRDEDDDYDSYRLSPDDRYRPSQRRRVSRSHRTDPVYRSDLPRWAHGTGTDYDDDTDPSLAERAGDAGDRVKSSFASAKDAAASSASAARDRVSDAASATGDAVSDTASSAAESAGNAWDSARSGLADTAAAAKARAARIRRQVSEGTEALGEEARARVIAARERAIEARDQAERAMRRGADQAADFYNDHPIVAGALAVAAGAAVAGALPRSRFEDEHIGGYSDDLFHEAERIYQEERDKAEKVVNATVSEAKKAAQDAKQGLDNRAPGEKSAVEAVTEKAKSASQRVAETAKTEAKKEGLGKPDS